MHEPHSMKRGIKYLGTSILITFSFFFVELIGGIVTNSLALITDAGHMLNDALALTFSLVAAWLTFRPRSAKRTFGYYRAEVLAAFLNGLFLWGVIVYIFYEALQRIMAPSPVESLNMLIIAVLGLIANGLSVLVLSQLREENLNIRGAFLHVLADTLGSVGAILAGIIMHFTGWYQTDPIISMLICILILYSSGTLIRHSLNILLEGVPSHINLRELERRILEIENVTAIHDLHVWCITPPANCCLSAHVVIKNGTDRRSLTRTLIQMLHDEFKIDHPTLQLEEEDYVKAMGEH